MKGVSSSLVIFHKLVNNLFGSTPKATEPEIIPEPPKVVNRITKPNPFDLTNKESQILDLVLQGLTNKEISENSKNSKRTIETHRFNPHAQNERQEFTRFG